ncbi:MULTISPECIES: outer membrane protein assembly factor BamD [unclassified Agarivorans]|uniref:outer membrane protein assembly factor BamD n=1 Tax=unclassified Agarivorans TaxID=2636026 RepID=UPI0010E58378|nr:MULTISPECIES: outer membrane protein assembly factor BamD [unclassified Agarivorans]MDO6685071.1 outer membrane protein assembly factor BamD [Agarivorans sp. 3_MG-2023]MDO6715757.1 outer membrane protein assembly factor BamD [Agarivorans sp. 2_MG-2023]MDO6763908.1 outer membrane protein assembly factor BamD [Agarivorans sp. 1_MG-2023]GDY27803.1 outer membrane protein assembly factor BamD [Agarivorans sp. Toyoura001]
MMRVYKQTISVILLGLALSACSSSKEKPKIPDKPASELYAEAQTAINNGAFTDAADNLEALDTRYPFGPYSSQVQLDLIYVYYKRSDTAMALASSERFIRNNPTHSALDYVYYMRGLTNMSADYNLFQSVVGIDRYDRDPSFSRQAFNDFSTLINRYPRSDYAPDAKQRMVYLKDNLARHEVAVARYYIKREAFIGAVNRARYVIENFPDTPSARDALEVMEQGYKALGVTDKVEQTALIRSAN